MRARANYRGAAAVSVTLAILLCACGASAPTPTVSGRSVFAQQCSSCHSLIGNESLHKPGGDLVGFRASRRQMLEFVTEMPTPRRLSTAEVTAVVNYVLKVERRGSPGP